MDHLLAAGRPAIRARWTPTSSPTRPTGRVPFVVFGAAALAGSAPVDELVVLGAWIDPTGRIQAVAEGIVGPIGDDPVSSGGAVDVVLAADGVASDAQLLVWVSGP